MGLRWRYCIFARASIKEFAADTPEHYTDNGERVRSKSEILIANALKKHNIPYRYEAPLYLNGYGTIHPDFPVFEMLVV